MTAVNCEKVPILLLAAGVPISVEDMFSSSAPAPPPPPPAAGLIDIDMDEDRLGVVVVLSKPPTRRWLGGDVGGWKVDETRTLPEAVEVEEGIWGGGEYGEVPPMDEVEPKPCPAAASLLMSDTAPGLAPNPLPGSDGVRPTPTPAPVPAPDPVPIAVPAPIGPEEEASQLASPPESFEGLAIVGMPYYSFSALGYLAVAPSPLSFSRCIGSSLFL